MPTPKYEIGQVLRYGGGPTALFRVASISPNHGGHVRYYGEHCMGGVEGRYESQCELASSEDMTTWSHHAAGRANTARRSSAPTSTPTTEAARVESCVNCYQVHEIDGNPLTCRHALLQENSRLQSELSRKDDDLREAYGVVVAVKEITDHIGGWATLWQTVEAMKSELSRLRELTGEEGRTLLAARLADALDVVSRGSAILTAERILSEHFKEQR